MRSRSILGSVVALALCFCVVDGARAQSLDWARKDGGTVSAGGQSVESAAAIAVDSLGNSYVTGTFRIEATFGVGAPNPTVLAGVGAQDIFVAKYDPNGQLVWARGAGGGGFQDWSSGIAVDAAGNSYVTGGLGGGTILADFGGGVTLTSPGAFVVKYDTNGTAAWATTLDPGGVAYAIGVDADGDSFVAGATTGPLPGLLPLIAAWKVDANGATQWTRVATGVYAGAAIGISVDSTGNSSMTGEVQRGTATFGSGPLQTDIISPTDGGVLFVASYDASGNLRWARQSTAATQAGASPRGNAMSTDAAGNSYLAGVGSTILGPVENQQQVTTAFVAKYDGLGNLVWARSVAPPFGQVSWLFAIASNSAGDIYVTGTVTLGVIFIEKYSSSGDLLWSRRLAGIVSDTLALQGNGISLDSAGNAYLAGQFSGTVRFGPGDPHETLLSTTSGNFDFDIFLAKYLTEAAQNTAPVADDQNVTTAEDTPLAITLSASDADGDPLIYTIVTPPAHGLLSGDPPFVIYTPNPNYYGADEFTFHVFDTHVFSNTATVTINVTPVNDRPVANNQTVATSQDTPVAITLTGQDIEGSSLSFDVATGPSHGTLSGSGANRTYTPFLGYVGPDSFTFTAFDGAATSESATVSITVGFTNIGCGILMSGSIAAAGEVDHYSFHGQAGHIISLALASTGGFSSNPTASNSAALMLFAPSGQLLGTIHSNGQANFTLPETGTYELRVSATNLRARGTYNLNRECLFPEAVGAVPLSCGTLASGTIGAAAQVDLYTFSGHPGQVISLALASTGGFASNPTSSNGVALWLFAPSGNLVVTFNSNGQANITLPQEAGTYVIRVSATNLAARGTYNLNLECLFPEAVGAVPLSCGTLASGTISAAAQVDLYSFPGQPGQIISLAIASTGGLSSNPTSSNGVALWLFAPSGNLVATFNSNGQANITLPQEAGTYVIRVSATNLAARGSYNLNLECIVPQSPDAVPLTCGTPVSGTIGAAAEVDLFTFSGQSGQIVSLAIASAGGFSSNPTASNSAALLLFAPSGTPVATLHSNGQANITLTETGTHVIGVSATKLATAGSYRITLGCPALALNQTRVKPSGAD